MISNPCIEVQTTAETRFSVSAWFAEVVIIAGYLEQKGLLKAFAYQVHLVRGHFGTYEPIDFLALLIGYAIRGERTLAEFFERVAPFATAFMALFGRKSLPHRSSLSRFLADVDHPCVEAFRTLFEQYSFAEGWTPEMIGGVFDRQGCRYIVFDVDASRLRPASCPAAVKVAPAATASRAVARLTASTRSLVAFTTRFNSCCSSSFSSRSSSFLGLPIAGSFPLLFLSVYPLSLLFASQLSVDPLVGHAAIKLQ